MSKYFAFCLIVLGGIQACGIYAFKSSGKGLSDYKTIYISNFATTAAGSPVTLPLAFNEKIKEYYQRNTRLKLVQSNADLQMEGSIASYETSPQAPTAQDKAGLNRLTIVIQVKFTNLKDETQDFDQNFSFFQDFPQSQTLKQVEAELIPKILDQIVLDIFNKTAGDW